MKQTKEKLKEQIDILKSVKKPPQFWNKNLDNLNNPVTKGKR
jgi:hypothetical protein